jgi:hypothetical protein
MTVNESESPIGDRPELPSLTGERTAEAHDRAAAMRRASEPVVQSLLSADQRRVLEQARSEDFAKAREASRQRLEKLRAAHAELRAKRPTTLERIWLAARGTGPEGTER